MARSTTRSQMPNTKTMDWGTTFRGCFEKRVLLMFLFGFSAALPLLLTTTILGFWLSRLGVDPQKTPSVTVFGRPLLFILPVFYVFKFLWAPFLDKLSFPFLTKSLGKRRGMAVGMQILLIISILVMGQTNPATQLSATAWFAALVVIFSASQILMLDALRIQLLSKRQQAFGIALLALGCYFALAIINYIFFFLAGNLSLNWGMVFTLVALLQGVGILAVIWAKDAEISTKSEEKLYFGEGMANMFVYPIRDFFKNNQQWLVLIGILLLYKYVDAMLSLVLNDIFNIAGFLKDQESAAQASAVVQNVGWIMSLLGSFLAGLIIYRHGYYLGMTLGLILATFGNIMFGMFPFIGANLGLLGATVAIDNIGAGYSTVVLLALIASIITPRHSVTQSAWLIQIPFLTSASLSSIPIITGMPFFTPLFLQLPMNGLAIMFNKILGGNIPLVITALIICSILVAVLTWYLLRRANKTLASF